MTETMTVDSRQEWLDAAGEGDEIAAARLAAALAEQPGLAAEMAAEQARWNALHRALAADRIAVREGFQQRVMAALPEPAWQKSSAPKLYPVLVAALLACAVGATFLLGGLADQPLAGTGLALADFFQTTLLAGSGLLAATWVGLGFGLEETFARSGASLLAFGAAVLFLNLLFFSLLRRRRATPAAARESGG